MKFHILKVLYDLESHAKDGRCGLSRNEDIRRYVGKLIEKQTLMILLRFPKSFFNFIIIFKNHPETIGHTSWLNQFQQNHVKLTENVNKVRKCNGTY